MSTLQLTWSLSSFSRRNNHLFPRRNDHHTTLLPRRPPHHNSSELFDWFLRDTFVRVGQFHALTRSNMENPLFFSPTMNLFLSPPTTAPPHASSLALFSPTMGSLTPLMTPAFSPMLPTSSNAAATTVQQLRPQQLQQPHQTQLRQTQPHQTQLHQTQPHQTQLHQTQQKTSSHSRGSGGLGRALMAASCVDSASSLRTAPWARQNRTLSGSAALSLAPTTVFGGDTPKRMRTSLGMALGTSIVVEDTTSVDELQASSASSADASQTSASAAHNSQTSASAAHTSQTSASHASSADEDTSQPLAPTRRSTSKPRRGRGAASEEESEQKRHARREAKRQKELERATEKRDRTIRRQRKHMLKLGLKPSAIEVMLTSNMSAPEAQQASAHIDMVDLSILPVGHNLPLPPLQVPFDAFSFDGRFGISVLCMQTGRRDVPTICRFNFTPKEDAPVLIGAAGMQDPSEAHLYPSLCAAAKRANLKAANGWTFFYTLVVWNDRTYRVPLIKFRSDNSGGPGFVQRPGVEYTSDEISRMCKLASGVHPSSKAYLQRRFWDCVGMMGRHRPRDVVPQFLEPLLRVLPNLITPTPKLPVEYGQWRLPPVSRDFCPTFVQFA
jgi:hypothetical protein